MEQHHPDAFCASASTKLVFIKARGAQETGCARPRARRSFNQHQLVMIEFAAYITRIILDTRMTRKKVDMHVITHGGGQ